MTIFSRTVFSYTILIRFRTCRNREFLKSFDLGSLSFTFHVLKVFRKTTFSFSCAKCANLIGFRFRKFSRVRMDIWILRELRISHFLLFCMSITRVSIFGYTRARFIGFVWYERFHETNYDFDHSSMCIIDMRCFSMFADLMKLMFDQNCTLCSYFLFKFIKMSF